MTRGDRHTGPGERLPTDPNGASDDEEPAYDPGPPLDRDTGPRFLSTDSETWHVEQELARGRELPEDANRAIPLKDHHEHGDGADADELRERVRHEAERDHTNKKRVAHLNERIGRMREHTPTGTTRGPGTDPEEPDE